MPAPIASAPMGFPGEMRVAQPDRQDRPAVDRAAAARAIADLLKALGFDAATEPELRETPARVAELYAGLLDGTDLEGNPELATFPHTGGDDLVIVRDLEFHALCLHHLVPFFGTATIAYRPGKHLIGFGGPARLLDWAARRPQLQERMAADVADQLERLVAPRGLAVILVGRHLCMEMRGAKRRAEIETRVLRGDLADPSWLPALRPIR